MKNKKERVGFWKKREVQLTFAIFLTIIWIELFPFVLTAAVMSSRILDSPTIPIWVGYILLFFAFLIPFSLLATTLSIWLCYHNKKASLMYMSNLIPFATVLFVIIIYILISFIGKMFGVNL